MRFNSHKSTNITAVKAFRTFYLLALPIALLPTHLSQYMLGSPEATATWLWLKCPTLALFDILCPTCGLGRSLIAAVYGNWNQSMQYHPLGLILLLSAGFIWVLFLLPFRDEFLIKQFQKLKNFWHLKIYQKGWHWLLLFGYIVWGFLRHSQ